MVRFHSKITVFIAFLLFGLSSSHAKSTGLSANYSQKQRIVLDSLVFEAPLFTITQNKTNLLYSLWNERSELKFDSIKDFHAYANGVQIITTKNELLNIPILTRENYYDQESFIPVTDVHILQRNNFVCGTVPHYTLTIKETKDGFDLYRDKTFYDSGNAIAPEKYASFSKKEVDEVFFINLQKSYSFSSNSQHKYSSTAILRKGNRFWINGTAETYSSISWTGENFKVEDNGLYSFYILNKVPTYIKLTKFEGYYARFTDKTGREGFLTREGKEI